MTNLRCLNCLLLCSLTAGAAGSEEPTYTLRYQFADGQVLRYESRQTGSHYYNLGGNERTDKYSALQRRVFTISDVAEDGTARASMQYEFVRMSRQLGDAEPNVFDTRDTEAEVPPAFRAAAAELRGSAPVYVIAVGGLPTDDEGVVLSLNTEAAQESAGRDEVIQASAESETQSDVGDAAFMLPLPKEPLAVGDTWKTYRTVKVRATAEYEREIRLLQTYKLQKVEGDIATITFSTSISSPVRSHLIKAQLLQSKPSGTIRFDLARGLLLRREMRFSDAVIGAMAEGSLQNSAGTTVETLIEDE